MSFAPNLKGHELARWVVIAALSSALAQTTPLGGVPGWAELIAEDAPPLEAKVYEEAYRVLFTETRWVVNPDGTLGTRWRSAKQSLSAGAWEMGIGAFPFERDAKVKLSKAWHVPPGERGGRTWGPPVDVTVGSTFLTDAKARFVEVAGVRRGSLIFFEFEATEAPILLSRQAQLYEGVAIARSRVELETPPGWSVRWAWLRGPGPEPSVSGNLWVWEVKDIPSPKAEPLGANPADLAPLLVLNLSPPPGATVVSRAVSDWGAYSVWWSDLAAGKERLPAESIKAAMKDGSAPDAPWLDKLRSAATYVRDSVRYLDIELGIGSFQPSPASETLTNLYGDCKAKAVLLRGLLAPAGIEAYPVLVNATEPETVAAGVPTLEAFDHAITAVPVPAGVELPPWALPAIVESEDLGRLLILDTTDEFLSPGSLPANLAGKHALVAAGPRGRLVTLRASTPGDHVIEMSLEGALGTDRALKLRQVSRYFGEPAILVRADARRASVERRRHVEERLAGSWADAVPRDYALELETQDGLAIEKISWTVPPLPEQGPDAAIPLFPGAPYELPRVALGTRKTAVVFPFPMRVRYETHLAGVPEGLLLPRPREVRGDGWSSVLTCKREGGSVTATLEVVLERTRFEPEAFGELRKLWSTAGADSSVILRPAP